MTRRRVPPFPTVVLLVALLPACEHAVTISGTVTVPPEVQALFSMDEPGKLELRGTMLGDNGKAVLPYLCAATDHAVMVSYQFTALGCAHPQEIQVRAFRVAPDHLQEVRCGEASSRPSGAVLGEELAYGATTIFQDRSLASCESASAVADVILAPTE